MLYDRGERETVAVITPILRPLAIEQGYVHAGPPGALLASLGIGW
jgi:6-phosphogluconate dehydrogenase (decarboxylating)